MLESTEEERLRSVVFVPVNHEVTVENTTDEAITYDVITDLDCLSGDGTLHVGAREKVNHRCDQRCDVKIFHRHLIHLQFFQNTQACSLAQFSSFLRLALLLVVVLIGLIRRTMKLTSCTLMCSLKLSGGQPWGLLS